MEHPEGREDVSSRVGCQAGRVRGPARHGEAKADVVRPQRRRARAPGRPVIVETWTFDRDFMPASVFAVQVRDGRAIEKQLLRNIRKHELINDDKVIPDTFDVGWFVDIDEFGVQDRHRDRQGRPGRRDRLSLHPPDQGPAARPRHAQARRLQRRPRRNARLQGVPGRALRRRPAGRSCGGRLSWGTMLTNRVVAADGHGGLLHGHVRRAATSSTA